MELYVPRSFLKSFSSRSSYSSSARFLPIFPPCNQRFHHRSLPGPATKEAGRREMLTRDGESFVRGSQDKKVPHVYNERCGRRICSRESAPDCWALGVRDILSPTCIHLQTTQSLLSRIRNRLHSHLRSRTGVTSCRWLSF